ncbi:MogA/MoaB family molybdenum cofactor biosynthesis protein [Okibacterium endophyticum]
MATVSAQALPAAVITVSDRAFAGARADESGPLAVRLLAEGGCLVDEPIVVADEIDAITDAIGAATDAGARLVVTTGGTGVSPRDVTPQATAALLRLELPGVAEAIRRNGGHPAAPLSRGIAGIVGIPGSLVVNLPGSPGGVRDGIPVLLEIAAHAVNQLDGGDH